MVEKLKSISRQIPWSLALKAAVFGLSWLLLPLWAFAALAVCLYLFPLFQSFKFIWHFAILLALVLPVHPGLSATIFFSVIFYFILGLKDFLFINRRAAYETLVLLFVFAIGVKFYVLFDHWSLVAVFSAFFAGLLFFLLGREFAGYVGMPSEGPLSPRWPIALFILSLLLSQLLIGILVLPLNFLYQAALFFLSATVLAASVFDYFAGTLTPRRLLANFSLFLVFATLILGSAPWSL